MGQSNKHIVVEAASFVPGCSCDALVAPGDFDMFYRDTALLKSL